MFLRKGQVTIFIIIGIILLISAGIFIYLYQAKIVRPFEEVTVPSVAKAPLEVMPVYDFVSACVELSGKEALRRVGDYGGYVDSSHFLYNPFMPTEGDAVQFSPDSDLVIPYWWHLKSSNDCVGDCVFSTHRPELHRSAGKVSIAAQLDRYVNENLKDCLAGFSSFVEQNFEFDELGPVETETTISKDAVYFVVKYPLRISRAGQSWDLREFLAVADLNLGRIYELALEITNLEAEHKWLEHFTVEMIDSFSALDRNMLPPMHDFDIDFGPGVVWVRSKAESALQEILAGYVPLLQVGNTRMYMPISAPDSAGGQSVRDSKLYEALYNRGLLIPLEKDFTDIGVSFAYLPWWKPYFDMNCEGEVCLPQSVSISSMFLMVGLHKYAFSYDVSYPVLVEVRDFDAFKGEGYSFKFFIEANVRNNAAMPSEFRPLEPYEISFNTMLCDINQKSSGNITVFVRDARNKRGVDKALVGYTCGMESCVLGSTVNGTLVARLPRCIGGMIGAGRQGYLSGFVPLDVVDLRDFDAEVVIEPYRYVDFSVKKYLLGKGAVDWSLDTENSVVQAMDEDTIILLSRQSGILEPAFNAVAEVCGMPGAKAPYACGSPPVDNSENIALVPGKYNVRIYSLKHARPAIEIPRDLRFVGEGPLKKEFYVPEEPIVFDAENPFPAGFADFEWDLSAEMLDSGNAVEFYYIHAALDKVPKSRRKIEDLGVIGKAMGYSEMYRHLLEPRIFRKEISGEHKITVKP